MDKYARAISGEHEHAKNDYLEMDNHKQGTTFHSERHNISHTKAFNDSGREFTNF